MAAGITHDFNNLLTVIGGYADLLSEDLPDSDALREIRRACGRATQLTRRLLAFTRRQPVAPEPLDLVDLLGQMETLLPRVLGDHIRVEVAGPGRPLHVLADPGQLDQVLLNLALNARDAMPRGGTLSFALSEEQPPGRSGPWARLVVRDTGHGMDAETLSHLFEPYFTTKAPGEGTGLGLASVYGIVTQAGGSLRCESAPGRGTAFDILLPCTPLPPLAPVARAAGTAAKGGRETILLAEDSEPLRTLMAGVLRARGYRVLEAAHGEEALRTAWSHPERIDLLLTDIVMPEMDGRELARLLSGSRPGLRVLLATGQADLDPSSPESLPPDVPVLIKPFSTEDLLRKVRARLAPPP
jgi:hypothetical protein